MPRPARGIHTQRCIGAPARNHDGTPEPAHERALDPLLRELLDHRAQFIEVARRVVRCRVRAEDVVQDAAVKVCQEGAAAGVRNPGSFLRRMVRNLAIDAARQTGRECRLGAPDEAADTVAAPCDCPLRRLEAHQALKSAMQALEVAPRRTREAFVAHRVDGVPQKVVAARFGVSPTLVNFMIRDATALCRAAATT